MKSILPIRGALVLSLLLAADVQLAQVRRESRPPATPAKTNGQTAETMPVDAQRELVNQYCATCHNDTVKAGTMSLAAVDLAHMEQHAELAEKMIRKLRAGMMPPPAARRPDAATLQRFAASLEATMDRAASA